MEDSNIEKLTRAILVGIIAGLVLYITNPYDLNLIVTLLIITIFVLIGDLIVAKIFSSKSNVNN